MKSRILLLCLAFILCFSANAQLSDLHYLPPLKQGQNNAGISQQAVYLSTPEPTPFTVNVFRGTNNTPVASFNISNTNGAEYTMSNGDNNIILVDNANTGVVLNNSGLRFEAPSGNSFYVNYRGSSGAQSASLTSKGRVAMGTNFKWGGVPNLGNHPSKSNTLGIMATEDNTTINLFGYDPGCEFRVGTNRAGITANNYQVTLDANESFVFETYIGSTPTQAHEDGWIGASIVSDKNIVISNGSINYGREVGATNRDAGIDQPVPEDRLGREYVFVRGNGNVDGRTEFPLLIAIADNTQIFINGSTTSEATINEGDYYQVPSNFYSSNTAGANMYIETSRNVYAYQCVAGSSDVFTQGLNFVAPVSCLLPDTLDNIPDIRNMAGTTVTGGVTIIAAVNTPDANISVSDGNGPVTLPPSDPVAGSNDWKTFYIPNLNGDVSVDSSGPMAIGFFGFNGARGVAGYFSGFDTVPEVNLGIRGGQGCFVGSEIFEATGEFDAYQWFEDGDPIPGANGPTFTPGGAGDFFLRGTRGPCTYDSNFINALFCDPDVVLNKTVDNPEIAEGETATFTIHVRNLGVGPLTNLQITDNIPAGLTLISSFTITGSFNGSIWDIGTLDGGESAELELLVQGDEIDTLPLVNIINTATNSQNETDTNRTEDNPSARIIVHNDFDNDGVIDIVDVDDDNDGIFDADECSTIICFETIVNESFESPTIPNSSSRILNENNVPGWQTTATDSNIEIWSNQFLGVPSFDGNQFAELNATQNSALYQNLCLTPGTVMNWSLRHRGRSGVDVMRVRIGGNLATATEQARMSDDNIVWGLYSGTYTVPLGQTNTVFIFEAISTAGNDLSIGNLIDDIRITIADVPMCADDDNDGLPNNIDLDSDDDGCSDANEFYNDANADGGDGGEFGSGTPNVNPDGSVIHASYVSVEIPEILLENTVEDLGGNDINGQDVSLGQTLEYVLRFQNTGNENAVNYTIRDILPNNVTFNSIDISNAPNTTYTFDLITQTLNFQIPDDLVEVGDPQYSIRIEVAIAANCSEFIAACSSILENFAFSTYESGSDGTVFTDENGSTSISACGRVPEVASNSILNDLTTCNEARTIQLCGDNVILSAGTGFDSYNWVLDTNNNGQIDSTDTIINDGDPDNDSSTIDVSTIGTYIVEKSSNSNCPDLVERIVVERFGTTQTNPIIDYLNQVNNDANPDNDIQGEMVACSIDGSILPRVFLCGKDDEATIQLGITDAVSIVWEKLDETSCTDSPTDCANTNNSCVWNPIANGNNFTLTENGEFRVVINYQNGCFSRFYFDVFKNELDLEYTSSDILCSTPGNIRITNIGNGFGYQLVDAADNDNIIISYANNNGPNFDISNSGTYKIQVTQLNPADGTPIVGGCVFETEDIGVQELVFDVDLSSTPQDCNALGTVTVQALNAQPNYSYELRLDDGSNGGDGSLVSNQPALNDNTIIFTDVNHGDYIVVTRTQDGCLDSQQITVTEIDELTLSASTTSNITCNSGVVTLTPNGGIPNTDYLIAIWSRDGTDLYTDVSNIPTTALEDTTNFLFRDEIDAGEYRFIVIDDNGCSAISNTVRVDYIGVPEITATNTDVVCSGSSSATLTVDVTGGTAPYQYSLDGGVNYQNGNTFVNLAAGIHTITVMDSSSINGVNCVSSIDYEITEPFRLSATASIIEDASCSPNGALVRINNPNGGQAPYEYSFNGGAFSSINTSNLLPGNHVLMLRDALDCTYNISLFIPNDVPDPSFNNSIGYDCEGEGTITITPSNTSDFTYSYTLNNDSNTTTNTNVFNNVPVGTHNISIEYLSNAESVSNVFIENFGSGQTTQVGEAGSGYCYEPQDGTPTNCNLGPQGILVDGEYTVTNNVTNPIPAYRNPNDHTGLTLGRFFAINPSNNLVSNNSVLWNRQNLEILPNRDITISLWAYNLRQVGFAGNNPEIEIQLVDGTGTIIDSSIFAEIPKNNNPDDWHNRTITFNPGANTNVSIVLRSNQAGDDGNELILDDIQASQVLEPCTPQSVVLNVEVLDNQEFSASLLNIIEPSCNDGTNGAVRFTVSNFDALTGFEYTTDGVNWITEFSSPVTTAANLSSGNYTIQVRRVNDNSCITDFPAILTEPLALVANASITEAFSCNNTGATITATASDGSPTYQYQLEITDDADSAVPYTNIVSIVTAYQDSPIFNNVPASTAGQSYVVRVRDSNGCDDVIDASIIVTQPETIVFDTTPTPCYDGDNNASILVNVTNGNGGYQFRIDNGPWLTPTPANATAFTFNNLSNDTYTIDVRDQFGCPPTANTQTVVIANQLIVDVDVTNLSACNDGLITVNATGGNGTLEYAIVPANTTPTTFTTTNTLTITEAMATANPAGYDVYVQDNSGGTPICTFIEEDIILTPVTPLSVNATPTDPECFDGLGHIDVTVTGGTDPYTYTLVDLSPADGIDYGRSNASIFSTTQTFNGIGVGDYEITIIDENTCSITSSTITIANAIEISADITPILPVNCTSTIESDFGFEFDNVITPTGTPGTVEYSNDGGTTWQTSNELRGTVANPTFSGTEVFPSIRVEVSPGVFCQRDFERYIIPFPLDDLDITLSAIVVGCNDLRVTVEGGQGDSSSGYDYTYTDDPANFNTFITDPNVWIENIALGTSHTFQNSNATTPQYPEVPLLVPGRTYVFYVRDGSGCIRQSNVNVNEIPLINLPIEITADITPSCDSAANGSITFNLNPTNPLPEMRWEIFEVGNTTPIETSGGNVAFNNTITTTVPLAEGDYHIDVVQVDSSNVDACRGASENIFVLELAPLAANAVVTRDISCNLPGLISINGISGGGGAPYAYDVSGPAGLTLSGTTDNPVQIPVNSPAGNYIVTLHDQFGCSLVLNPVTLTLAPNPTLSVTHDNCQTPITLNAVGASTAGNLRYAIVASGNPAPTTFEDNAGIFTNVTPGIYDVYVIDGNGCTTANTGFTVNPVLSASASLTKLIDCTASPDAIINIEILDGSSNYQYTITNTVGATEVATPIAVPSTNFNYQTSIAGDYTITIYDTTTPNSSACNREFIVNVPDRLEPNITVDAFTDVTCNTANNGTISVNANPDNGIGPYTFTIISGPGSTATFPINPTNNSNSSAFFDNLEGTNTGITYTIRATAANGCTQDTTQTITQPDVITLTMDTPVEFSCTTGNNQNNASISVLSTTGGSNNFVRYQFFNNLDLVNPVQDGTNTTYIETNPAGGNYTIIVFDDNGCTDTANASIAPFDVLGTPIITIDDAITCGNLGEDITINVSGSITNSSTAAGLANYEFRQLPATTYQASNSFVDLQVGTYNFVVRNISTNCETTITHIVEEPNTFNLTVDVLSNTVCFGDNGTVQFNITDTTYTGDFTLNIYDTEGTANTADDTLILTQTNVPVGLTPSIDFTGGNYLVVATQNNTPDCSQTRAFTIISAPEDITISPIDLVDVGCDNDSGSATISPIGGIAPYNITLTNTSTGTIHPTVNQVNAHIFEGLAAGQFSIEVTDALGCTRTFANAFELIVPDLITGTINATSLACEGDTDATINFTLNPRNITTNYRYILNTFDDIAGTNTIQVTAPQASETFTNIGTGFYSIIVIDDIGCSYTTEIIEIANPAEVSGLLITTQSLSCDTGAELQLTASGGTGPYMWSEDGTNFNAMNVANGPNTHVFQNVTAGDTYAYYLQDSEGCTSIRSNTISIEPIEELIVTLDLSAAVINCSGESTAFITATADGGLGNYEYALFADQGLINQVRPYQNTGDFADLPQGTYYVNVQSEDCETTSEVITIVDPAPLNVTRTVTHVSCAGANDGSIVINAQGGSGTFQYAITPNLNQFDTHNIYSQLSAGNYTVIIQDSNGCFEVINFTITEPDAIEVEVIVTPEICSGDEDGTITIAIDGGTAPYSTSLNSNNDEDFIEGKLVYDSLASETYVVFVKDANGCITNEIIEVEGGANLAATAEVIYECTGDTAENSVLVTLEDSTVAADILYGLDTADTSRMVLDANFQNLDAGEHFITIAHANGCVNTLIFEVEQFLPLQLVAEEQNLNEITAIASDGREDYTYFFNDIDNGNDNKFYITETDTYSVRVVDANGCEATTSIFIEFIDIEIPTFFTPDGDGLNDNWLPTNIEAYPNIFIKVYDRYGREVYTLEDNEDGWNGLYLKHGLPTGDYWYVIKLNGAADQREFVGNFTLYR